MPDVVRGRTFKGRFRIIRTVIRIWQLCKSFISQVVRIICIGKQEEIDNDYRIRIERRIQNWWSVCEGSHQLSNKFYFPSSNGFMDITFRSGAMSSTWTPCKTHKLKIWRCSNFCNNIVYISAWNTLHSPGRGNKEEISSSPENIPEPTLHFVD